MTMIVVDFREATKSIFVRRVLDSMRGSLEGEKRHLARLISGIGSPGNPVAESLVSPLNRTATNVLNRVAISLTTPQQLADNLAVMQHALDRSLERFDPTTGFLRPAPSGESSREGLERLRDSWFDQFYFMYTDWISIGGPFSRDNLVVRGQSSLDQAALAATLEIHRRATGQYPASIEMVAGAFPGGLPRDLATGESYRYRRTDDGGYLLWGAGVDQKDHQGDRVKDVVWRHVPTRD